MSGIHFFYDKVCLKHTSDNNHPERPARIFSMLKTLKQYPGILTEYHSLSDQVINSSELFSLITSIHSKRMLDLLINSQYQPTTYFTFDCIANNFTYAAALASAALALQAGKMSTSTMSYFALVRPPGHHATNTDFMGFCYLNNIAVAAQYLSSQKKKIAIIDFDYHYGNGTAKIFWKNPMVLYISVHADPSINYPYCGFIHDIGEDEGKGYNICIPLTFGSGNIDLVRVCNELILPILYDFHPDCIGVSAGFDGFRDDPIGRGFLKYDSVGYHFLGSFLYYFAQEMQIHVFNKLEVV